MKKISGTNEWSGSSVNFMKGCPNGCLYCYGNEIAVRFKRVKNHEEWKDPIFNKKAFNKNIGKRDKVIMFPSTHDIYPEIISQSINFLTRLLKSGNKVLIVSKPNFQCINQICASLLEFKNQILFRFTIGSHNNRTLKFWEPNAPEFEERHKSLRFAFNIGYATSISCEPMLGSVDDTFHLVSLLFPWITDSIWIGKMNKLERCKINGHDNPKVNQMLDQIREYQSDDEILRLYNRYKDNSKIKWKESIKKVVGIDLNQEKGMDI
jgi:hypothetical protein